MNKESFILFTEFQESFAELSNEESGILIKAIFEYATTGIEPKLDKLLKLVFIPIKQCIDRNSQNYENIKNLRSEAGKKGMEKRWGKNNSDNKNNKNDFVIEDSNINNAEEIQEYNKITNDNKNNKAILLYNKDNKNNLYVSDDVSVDVSDDVLLSPLTPQGENVMEKNSKQQIPKNSKTDFIDYQFVEEEYGKGEFDFNLDKFWNFWKDKGLRKSDLANKMIAWDIRQREKNKTQSSKNGNLYGQFKYL